MTRHDPRLADPDLLTALRHFRLTEAQGTLPHGPGLFSYCVHSRERLVSVRLPHPVIGIVLSGRKEIWRGLDQQVLRAGTAFALPGGIDMDIVNEPDPVTGLYQSLILEISPAMVPPLADLPAMDRAQGGLALQMRPEIVRAVAHAADAIVAGPSVEQVRRVRLAELLALIADQPAARVLFDLPIDARICRLVQAAPDYDWTAARMARHLGLSESSLRRRLRETGTGFAALLRRQRMQNAHEMIAAGTASGVAADAVGYASRAHFARAYRAEFSVSPAGRSGGQVQSRPVGT